MRASRITWTSARYALQSPVSLPIDVKRLPVECTVRFPPWTHNQVIATPLATRTSATRAAAARRRAVATGTGRVSGRAIATPVIATTWFRFLRFG